MDITDKQKIYIHYIIFTFIKCFLCYIILIYTLNDSDLWIKWFIVWIIISTIIYEKN